MAPHWFVCMPADIALHYLLIPSSVVAADPALRRVLEELDGQLLRVHDEDHAARWKQLCDLKDAHGFHSGNPGSRGAVQLPEGCSIERIVTVYI